MCGNKEKRRKKMKKREVKYQLEFYKKAAENKASSILSRAFAYGKAELLSNVLNDGSEEIGTFHNSMNRNEMDILFTSITLEFEERVDSFVKEKIRLLALAKFEAHFLAMCEADTIQIAERNYWMAYNDLDTTAIDDIERGALLRALYSVSDNYRNEFMSAYNDSKAEEYIESVESVVNDELMRLLNAGTMEEAAKSYGKILGVLDSAYIYKFSNKYVEKFMRMKYEYLAEAKHFYHQVYVELACLR